MKQRYTYDGNGQWFVEKQYLSQTQGLIWISVASFVDEAEVNRCYPDAEREHHCTIDDGTTCSECCEHGDYDHGICGNCGTDCTDDLVGAAEYAFEGDR